MPLLAGYQIDFINAVCNPDNTQTWTYSVTKIDTPKPEISNWALILCSDPMHIVLDSSGPLGSTVVVGQGQPCLVTFSNTIKWENLSNDNVDGIYTFKLQGCFQPETLQNSVAVKAGPECYFGELTVPSCKPLNPPITPIRGIAFK
ncbi:hypothetical protein SAMN02745883_00342 [Caminicella sporogenes DSM 14501]|uniref:Uncharacterized protein n=1 Tax=Caminicella sporogenes DSM 14501 TaxID=1121266 RepID=A0A1M6LTU3_9FIRM|nr:hypothetical protein [Caminicella sporogenes]RKD27948.1 hypothetical protein BET04_02495 [Caminicella sporogenes]SHJ74560.1 hypothetical protein SAMN02745883_00342 [Caminicella sporogenes DSM 14501]